MQAYRNLNRFHTSLQPLPSANWQRKKNVSSYQAPLAKKEMLVVGHLFLPNDIAKRSVTYRKKNEEKSGRGKIFSKAKRRI